MNLRSELRPVEYNLEKNFKCHNCGGRFRRESYCKVHLIKCTQNNTYRTLKCKFCDFTTFKRYDLSAHFYKAHAKQTK
jgi:transcription elongation factor Elf1